MIAMVFGSFVYLPLLEVCRDAIAYCNAVKYNGEGVVDYGVICIGDPVKKCVADASLLDAIWEHVFSLVNKFEPPCRMGRDSRGAERHQDKISRCLCAHTFRRMHSFEH